LVSSLSPNLCSITGPHTFPQNFLSHIFNPFGPQTQNCGVRKLGGEKKMDRRRERRVRRKIRGRRKKRSGE
jgi:hypothetical protein